MAELQAEFRELFRRAREGDAEAVEALLQRHFAGLRAFVRLKSGRLVRARESCSDLVQSVCREALSDLRKIECDDESAFRQWLYSVALHKIMNKKDYHVAEKRDAARDVSFDAALFSEPGLLRSYTAFCSPSHDAEVGDEIARVESAFDELPEEYRDVIIQARLLGRSHRQIAEDTGRSEAAVRKLLSRARARLAVLLDG